MDQKIKTARIEDSDMSKRVIAVLEDDSEHLLFSYFPDELFFTEKEFEGLTTEQGRTLHRKKDTEWLQTPGPAGNGIARTS